MGDSDTRIKWCEWCVYEWVSVQMCERVSAAVGLDFQNNTSPHPQQAAQLKPSD